MNGAMSTDSAPNKTAIRCVIWMTKVMPPSFGSISAILFGKHYVKKAHCSGSLQTRLCHNASVSARL